MKRLTFITGYFGSGKTEFAVNLSLIKQIDMLVDLDIVNPYFRSRELEETMRVAGIRLVYHQIANGIYADLPYVSKEAFLPFYQKNLRAIFDLGGADLGAILLRQFIGSFTDDEYDLLLVVNPYRLETDTAEKIKKVIETIESSGGLKVTGFVNNPNLLNETTVEVVSDGDVFLKDVSKQLDIPIVYTSVEAKNSLSGLAGESLIIKRYFAPKWR